MQKKGQAAIFIILGLVLLILVIMLINFKTGFLSALFKKSSQEIVSVPEQLKEVTDFIDKCLETTARNSLYQIGRNGGYYKPPFETSIVWFIEEIPYYYLERKNYQPDKETIEKEFAKLIAEDIKNCLNFEEFEKQGFIITENNATVHTGIITEKIEIRMDYPIKIEKGSLKTETREFVLGLDSDMLSLIETAGALINIHSKNPQFICLTCLDEISSENEVIIDVYPITDVSYFENNVIIYLIEDKKYQIDSERSLSLRFVVEQK